MARWASALVVLMFAGLVLAGCASQPAADLLAERFGSDLIDRDGVRTVRGPLLEGRFEGASWGTEPNTTVEAPRVDLSNKQVTLPGGGTSVRLEVPAVEQTLEVRISPARDVSGLRVRWALGVNGSTPEFSEPSAASESSTLQVPSAGAFQVVAKLIDDQGREASTEPMRVAVHVRWTIDSSVWPLSASELPTQCVWHELAPASFCAGGWSHACAGAAGSDVCVGASPYGVYGGVCTPALCEWEYHRLPAQPPPVPRPPNYGEMADQFTFDVPEDSHVVLRTEYRGTWRPPSGTDVDLELRPTGGGAQGNAICEGFGGYGELPTSTEHARELIDEYIGKGTWMARVGAVSCEDVRYYNTGAVPYTATVLLEYGKRPPPCPTGGGGYASEAPEPTKAMAMDDQPTQILAADITCYDSYLDEHHK